MAPDRTCTDCAWFRLHGSTHHCQAQATGDETGPLVTVHTPACDRFEHAATVGCDDCGACCREAYDSVPVTEADVERLGPAYADRVRVHDDGWTDLHRVPSTEREGTRCIALCNRADTGHFYCDMYAVRPDTCRDVAIGSAGCLFARRRVGLSPP